MGKELKKVVADRDVVAHTASMTEDGEYETDRELRNIRIARTMLVALLAIVIGYHGKIRGLEEDPEWTDFVAPEAWWPVSEDDAAGARRVYLAEFDEATT